MAHSLSFENLLQTLESAASGSSNSGLYSSQELSSDPFNDIMELLDNPNPRMEVASIDSYTSRLKATEGDENYLDLLEEIIESSNAPNPAPLSRSMNANMKEEDADAYIDNLLEDLQLEIQQNEKQEEKKPISIKNSNDPGDYMNQFFGINMNNNDSQSNFEVVHDTSGNNGGMKENDKVVNEQDENNQLLEELLAIAEGTPKPPQSTSDDELEEAIRRQNFSSNKSSKKENRKSITNKQELMHAISGIKKEEMKIYKKENSPTPNNNDDDEGRSRGPTFNHPARNRVVNRSDALKASAPDYFKQFYKKSQSKSNIKGADVNYDDDDDQEIDPEEAEKYFSQFFTATIKPKANNAEWYNFQDAQQIAHPKSEGTLKFANHRSQKLDLSPIHKNIMENSDLKLNLGELNNADSKEERCMSNRVGDDDINSLLSALELSNKEHEEQKKPQKKNINIQMSIDEDEEDEVTKQRNRLRKVQLGVSEDSDDDDNDNEEERNRREQQRLEELKKRESNRLELLQKENAMKQEMVDKRYSSPLSEKIRLLNEENMKIKQEQQRMEEWRNVKRRPSKPHKPILNIERKINMFNSESNLNNNNNNDNNNYDNFNINNTNVVNSITTHNFHNESNHNIVSSSNVENIKLPTTPSQKENSQFYLPLNEILNNNNNNNNNNSTNNKTSSSNNIQNYSIENRKIEVQVVQNSSDRREETRQTPNVPNILDDDFDVDETLRELEMQIEHEKLSRSLNSSNQTLPTPTPQLLPPTEKLENNDSSISNISSNNSNVKKFVPIVKSRDGSVIGELDLNRVREMEKRQSEDNIKQKVREQIEKEAQEQLLALKLERIKREQQLIVEMEEKKQREEEERRRKLEEEEFHRLLLERKKREELENQRLIEEQMRKKREELENQRLIEEQIKHQELIKLQIFNEHQKLLREEEEERRIIMEQQRLLRENEERAIRERLETQRLLLLQQQQREEEERQRRMIEAREKILREEEDYRQREKKRLFLIQQQQKLQEEELRKMESEQLLRLFEEDQMLSSTPRRINDNELESLVNSLNISELNTFQRTYQTLSTSGYPYEIDPQRVILYENMGIGTFGSASKGVYDTKEVSVKILKCNLSQHLIFVEKFKADVTNCVLLEHINLVDVIGVTLKELSIVSEYITGASLHQVLRNKALVLDLKDKLDILRQIASGLEYLHSQKVIFRGLKANNIIIDAKNRVKMRDYGLPEIKSFVKLSGVVGTPQYDAPEVILDQPITTKADIFSFGILMWEIFSQTPPYSGMMAHQIITSVTQYNLRPPMIYCPLAIWKLMTACWNTDPSLRPDASKVRTILSQPLENLMRYGYTEVTGETSHETTSFDPPSYHDRGVVPSTNIQPQMYFPTINTVDQQVQNRPPEIKQEYIDQILQMLYSNKLDAQITALKALNVVGKSESTVPDFIRSNFFVVLNDIFRGRHNAVRDHNTNQRIYNELLIEFACRVITVVCEHPEAEKEARRVGVHGSMVTLITEPLQISEVTVLQVLKAMIPFANNRDGQIALRAAGIILPLIGFLKSKTELLVLQSVWVLSYLLEEEISQDDFFLHGGVRELMGLLSSQNPGIQFRSLVTLANLISNQKMQNMILKSNILTRFVQLFHSKSPPLRIQALKATERICRNEVTREELIRIGALPSLISLCNPSNSPEIINLALAILSHFVSDGSHFNQFKNANGLQVSLQLLSHPNTSIQKSSLEFFYPFIVQSDLNVEIARSLNFIPKCLQILEANVEQLQSKFLNEELIIVACKSICTMVENNNEKCIETVHADRGLELFVSLLHSPNYIVLSYVLQILSKLIAYDREGGKKILLVKSAFPKIVEFISSPKSTFAEPAASIICDICDHTKIQAYIISSNLIPVLFVDLINFTHDIALREKLFLAITYFASNRDTHSALRESGVFLALVKNVNSENVNIQRLVLMSMVTLCSERDNVEEMNRRGAIQALKIATTSEYRSVQIASLKCITFLSGY